jgi:hypothetical protein
MRARLRARWRRLVRGAAVGKIVVATEDID